jgi:hypothetical protein
MRTVDIQPLVSVRRASGVVFPSGECQQDVSKSNAEPPLQNARKNASIIRIHQKMSIDFNCFLTSILLTEKWNARGRTVWRSDSGWAWRYPEARHRA